MSFQPTTPDNTQGGSQSGSQFPKEDERLPGGMHWRPYFGVDTDVDRLLWSFAANEGQTNG